MSITSIYTNLTPVKGEIAGVYEQGKDIVRDHTKMPDEINPISNSTYYSEYFMGTEIRFKSLLPEYIYKAFDVDNWFSHNHKFYIIIQNDAIRFKDFGEFYYCR